MSCRSITLLAWNLAELYKFMVPWNGLAFSAFIHLQLGMIVGILIIHLSSRELSMAFLNWQHSSNTYAVVGSWMGFNLCVQALQEAHFTKPFVANYAKLWMQYSSRDLLQ